jgi:hypothetical protein
MLTLSDWTTSGSSEAKLPCLLKDYLVSVPYDVLMSFHLDSNWCFLLQLLVPNTIILLHFGFVSAMVSWCTKLPLLVFPLTSAIPIFTYLTALCILVLRFHLFAHCFLGDIIYHVPPHPFELHICLESSTVLVCGGIIYYCSLVTIVYPVACNQ